MQEDCHVRAYVFITNVVSEHSLQQQIQDELSRFKAELCIPPEGNHLEWWKCNEVKYPHLAIFAKCVLAIPANFSTK